VKLYKDNVLQSTTSISGAGISTSAPVFIQSYAGGTLNAGQRAFAYTAPSGFKALCDTNLTSPTIAKPNTVMDVLLYTGNTPSTQTISGLGFSPDLVWLKVRNAGDYHQLYDSVRGATKYLHPNVTNAEATDANALTAFNNDGFSVGSTGGVNSGSMVAWCWDAGSSTVTNTQGSITSSVRANASAGFSVITYTGNGATNATVGHGCGTAPHLVIGKWRGGSSDWEVYHKAAGATKVLQLNNTNAAGTLGHFGSTDPTSTLITVNASGTGNEINGNGQSYVLYAFAPVAGFSAFGSYTGNGSSDGPFVFCGFRPRWILTKRYDGGANGWGMFDALRPGYNLTDSFLQAQSSGSESTGASAYSIDILSNGFKVRGTDAFVNQSGGSYIYCAFAESPLQYARAR